MAITMTFWLVWSCRMVLLPEGFMLFIFLTCVETFAFWKRSISGFCMGRDFFRKNDYHIFFWRSKKYLWWESSCFFGRSGGRWSHGSQRFLRENGLLRDHVSFFSWFFHIFLLRKKITMSVFLVFFRFLHGFYNVCDFLMIFGVVGGRGTMESCYFRVKISEKNA